MSTAAGDGMPRGVPRNCDDRNERTVTLQEIEDSLRAEAAPTNAAAPRHKTIHGTIPAYTSTTNNPWVLNVPSPVGSSMTAMV